MAPGNAPNGIPSPSPVSGTNLESGPKRVSSDVGRPFCRNLVSREFLGLAYMNSLLGKANLKCHISDIRARRQDQIFEDRCPEARVGNCQPIDSFEGNRQAEASARVRESSSMPGSGYRAVR